MSIDEELHLRLFVCLFPDLAVQAEIEQLRRELDVICQSGFAIVDQELEIGLRSIAVPVRDHAGTVVAAMNIGTHASRVTLAEMEKSFLPELAAAAQELGTLLLA